MNPAESAGAKPLSGCREIFALGDLDFLVPDCRERCCSGGRLGRDRDLLFQYMSRASYAQL